MLLNRICFIFAVLAVSCAQPGTMTANTVANSLQVTQAVENVNAALSNFDCNLANSYISTIYSSTATTNDVRIAMASTYACFAQVNFFQILTDLMTFASSNSLAGAGFYQFLALEFPSVSSPVDDQKPQAALSSIYALLSVLNVGAYIYSGYQINTSTNNPGSVLSSDRTVDSNGYLMMVSMALMGFLENRYGHPDSSGLKTVALPWITTATNVTEDGCAFASALLNFYDALGIVYPLSSGAVRNVYATIYNALATVLDVACANGCTLSLGSVSCTSCPISLRDYKSCTFKTTDVNSWATVGITTMVNLSWP